MKKLKELTQYILILLFVFALTLESFAQQGWFQQVSGTTLNLYSVYFIDANTGFVAADNGYILKTTNSGTNWTLINTGANRKLWQIVFVNSTTGFAGTDSNTIRSTNAGVTWDNSIIGGGTSISFFNQTTGFALKYRSCSDSLSKTTNSGINWSFVSIIPTLAGVTKISFRNENTGFAGNSFCVTFPPPAHCFISIDKTTNSGINWVQTYTGPWGLSGASTSDLFFLNDFFGVALHTVIAPTYYYFGNYIPVGT